MNRSFGHLIFGLLCRRKSIHIIGIFDPSKTAKTIEAVLNILKIQPESYGKEDAVTTEGPIKVIETIREQGGIPVLAHANSACGVLHDMSGQPRTLVIQHPDLLAAEGTDCEDAAKKKAHTRVIDYLDGSDPTYQRKLAVYQASDNPSTRLSGKHDLAGIGSRYSLFKLETINLDGLRQCLVDPDVRINLNADTDPLGNPRIERVKINSGFLENQEISFHEGMTSVLGGKGAGKSLLIEFMRFALNQEPRNQSIAQDHISKLRTQLGEHSNVEITFVDSSGARHTINRIFRELDRSPYDASLTFDPAQEFPVLFLSQNEIIKIAENEEEQLEFIDRFFDFRSYRFAIESLEHQLEMLDKRMAVSLAAFSEAEALETRTKALLNEIQTLDAKLKNPGFESFRQFQTKDQALTQQREYLAALAANLEKAKQLILAKVAPTIPSSLASDPSVLRSNDYIRKAVDAVENQFKSLSTSLAAELAKVRSEYDQWHPQYLAGKKKYEDDVQQMGGDSKALAFSREKAVRELTGLQTKLETEEAKKKEAPDISKQRNDLLDQLESQYDQYTKERQAKCAKFQSDSGDKLKLKILDSKNADEFRNRLLSLKRGSYLRDEEIGAITSVVPPRDFVISLLRYEASKETKHLKEIAQSSAIDLARMKTLADFLLVSISSGDLLALQYKAIPQDRPEILYNVGNGSYQPLSAISVGQKCTAMLLMALSEGTMPIIIDQPEDSLDIKSIWEDMCMKLRIGKKSRQFIFTTHNSSLAVASDTDCYLIIEADATHGKIVNSGSMDHPPLRDEVLRYLEGGEDTYLLKSKKYRVEAE